MQQLRLRNHGPVLRAGMRSTLPVCLTRHPSPSASCHLQLAYVLGFMGEYLSPAWQQRLVEHYGIPPTGAPLVAPVVMLAFMPLRLCATFTTAPFAKRCVVQGTAASWQRAPATRLPVRTRAAAQAMQQQRRLLPSGGCRWTRRRRHARRQRRGAQQPRPRRWRKRPGAASRSAASSRPRASAWHGCVLSSCYTGTFRQCEARMQQLQRHARAKVMCMCIKHGAREAHAMHQGNDTSAWRS